LRSRRVGISTYNRLMEEHGSAQEALAVLPEIAREAGVSDYKPCPEAVIMAELKAARAAGACLLVKGTAPYPELLAELADAPPFLWAVGDPALLMRPMVALVGARNASSLGTRMARALASELGAAGHVVVSGLARGIDAAAHLAALGSGTVAVQAGGVDILYPSENAELAQQIGADGLRLSEQPMGLQPMARHFPGRNRIISGLSTATVVVEAAARSGSLITARDALDQGREVLSVPGHPLDARAAGCNMLIRDGAVLVRSAADVLEALATARGEATISAAVREKVAEGSVPTGRLPAGERKAPLEPGSLAKIAALHRRILDRLGPSPLAEDQLIRDLQAPAAQIAPVLVDLELDGQIERQPGGLLTKVV
jgi:DNA processing protein